MEQNNENNVNAIKKLSSNEKNYATFDPNRDEQKNLWQYLVQSKQSIIVTFILFSMGVTNITDRYLVSSVLIDIQKYFDVSKSVAGLLQTAFLLVYMAFSPLSGYLGDRVNRKYLLVASLIIWITSTFSGSLVNENQFGLFVLSRCMFGVATAPFETIAVPIIGDQFRNNKVARNRALILFNLGPPVGTGLSYLIGTISKDLHPNDWRWCLRFTPVYLTFILFLILLSYDDPKRIDSQTTSSSDQQRTFKNDLKTLFKNKTYVLLIISWTCGLASLTAFNWWSSSLIDYSLRYANLEASRIDKFKKVYSILQVLSGTVGLLIPVELSNYFKKRGIEQIDTIFISISFFISSVFIYIYLITLESNIPYLSLFLFSIVTAGFNICWIVEANIFLDIVPSNIRSTANAIIICVLHLIGDSGSPYWVGLINDACTKSNGDVNTISSLLKCTRFSFYPLVFVSFAAAAFGLFMSWTFSYDKQKANEQENHLVNS